MEETPPLADRLSLSVILPVHDGAGYLARSLTALNASSLKPFETIVVDDASKDGSGEAARRLGARVVALAGRPRGPAFARNRGAAAACGDVLVFLDADVVIHPDALARMHRLLEENPGVAALFGSYDDDPPNRSLVSLYKNLLHHYVHQHGQPEAFTFWAGCGAIRRGAFDQVGGFDERYARPSIEDIELGTRLRQHGQRILLCPEIQVTHFKAWSLPALLRSDVFDRAVPWTRLILSQARVPDDLNLGVSSRISALGVWAGLAGLASLAWTPWGWLVAALAVSVVVGLNWDLYRFFARRGGLVFAFGAAALHMLYLAYGSAIFGGLSLARQAQVLVGSFAAALNRARP